MNLLRRLLRYDHTHYAWWEHWITRLAFASLIWRGYPKVTNYTGQPRPNGLAHFFDFTFFANPRIVEILQVVFVIALAFYAIGRLRVIALPVLTGILISANTLGNSQGAINHITQIMVLVMLGQTFSIWHAAIAYRKLEPQQRHARTEDNLIAASIQVMAAVYVVSGITKLVNSGGEWIMNVPNLAVQFAKNLDMHWYNFLTPAQGNTELIIHYVTHYPNIARAIFGTGLVLELFAFLALLNRWWALFMGLSLLLMHETISRIMHLGFLYNKLLLIIFFINIPWCIVWLVRRLRPTPVPA